MPGRRSPVSRRDGGCPVHGPGVIPATDTDDTAGRHQCLGQTVGSWLTQGNSHHHCRQGSFRCSVDTSGKNPTPRMHKVAVAAVPAPRPDQRGKRQVLDGEKKTGPILHPAAPGTGLNNGCTLFPPLSPTRMVTAIREPGAPGIPAHTHPAMGTACSVVAGRNLNYSSGERKPNPTHPLCSWFKHT